jgi:tetratricopeptide (TPR) repeat protein
MSRLSLFRRAGKVALPAALLLATSGLHGQSLPTVTPAGNQRPAVAGSPSGWLYQFRTDPAAEAPNGIVAVQDLAVPLKARREFQRSTKAFQSGDVHGAASHLEKAIQIAPDFAQAHNNLGAMYIKLRDYIRAVEELQKAIDLDPKLESAYHNLAMLSLLMGHLPEAEVAARQALQLDAETALSYYWLGRILVMERKNSPEAEQLLTHAAAQVPEAMLWVAQLLQNRGEISAAMTELQAYLQVCDADKRDKVQSWLVQLAKVAPNQNATRGEHQGS